MFQRPRPFTRPPNWQHPLERSKKRSRLPCLSPGKTSSCAAAYLGVTSLCIISTSACRFLIPSRPDRRRFRTYFVGFFCFPHTSATSSCCGCLSLLRHTSGESSNSVLVQACKCWPSRLLPLSSCRITQLSARTRRLRSFRSPIFWLPSLCESCSYSTIGIEYEYTLLSYPPILHDLRPSKPLAGTVT